MKCSRCKKELTQEFNAFGNVCCKVCFAVILNEAVEADEQDAWEEVYTEIKNQPKAKVINA